MSQFRKLTRQAAFLTAISVSLGGKLFANSENVEVKKNPNEELLVKDPMYLEWLEEVGEIFATLKSYTKSIVVKTPEGETPLKVSDAELMAEAKLLISLKGATPIVPKSRRTASAVTDYDLFQLWKAGKK